MLCKVIPVAREAPFIANAARSVVLPLPFAVRSEE